MKLFNKTNIAALFLSTTLALSSCDAVKNSNDQQRGTAGGAAAGAILGGILGNNIGHGGNTALGAILGGVIGGVAGNVIGKKMDNQARQIKETLPGATVERVNDGIKITLGENTVNFDFNSSNLTSTAKDNLDKLSTVLSNNPDTNINIFGYTDSKGTATYNLTLSARRAESVKNYLVMKGVASARMVTTGRGEMDPIASNDTDAGRAQNRRVEFAITANSTMINNAKQGN
jgi:outer membrane protein OmpA-like peptidoglycan-associated protein